MKLFNFLGSIGFLLLGVAWSWNLIINLLPSLTKTASFADYIIFIWFALLALIAIVVGIIGLVLIFKEKQ